MRPRTCGPAARFRPTAGPERSLDGRGRGRVPQQRRCVRRPAVAELVGREGVPREQQSAAGRGRHGVSRSAGAARRAGGRRPGCRRARSWRPPCPGCSSTQVPMTRAPRPYSCARIAASTRSASAAGTNASSLPSLATYSGSRPSSPQASRTSAGIGQLPLDQVDADLRRPWRSRSATPRRRRGWGRAARGRRRRWRASPRPARAAAAVSLATVVPNSSPSRQLITATPCTPMSPLTITTSPGRGPARPDVDARAATTPMPAVLTKTPSPAAAVDDLRVAGDEPDAGRPRRRARSPRRPGRGRRARCPPARMNAVDSASGVAPDIARSLTVPLTARSPIDPPGKNIGLTTYESVEKASRTPPTSTTAESPSSASAAAPNAGRNRCSTSSADMAPPPPWPITIVGESRSGAGQTQPVERRSPSADLGRGARSATGHLRSSGGGTGSTRRRRPRTTPSSRRAGCAACTPSRTPRTRAA